MTQTLTCLKIYAVYFLVHEHVTLGLKLRAQRDETRQSDETILLTPSDPGAPPRKWQVGRVSRKQYELINMIGRRTNIFVDVDNIFETETTTPSTKIHRPDVRPINDIKRYEYIHPKQYITKNYNAPKFYMLPIFQHTTPSYIEFYYLEEIVSDKKIKQNLEQQNAVSTLRFEKYSIKNNDSMERSLFSRSPRLLLNMHDLLNQTYNNQSAKRNPRKNDKKESNGLNLKALSKIVVDGYKDNRFLNKKTFVENDILDMSTARRSIDLLYPLDETSKEITVSNEVITDTRFKGAKVTTSNDKVKFFEIYDSDTEDPLPVSKNASDNKPGSKELKKAEFIQEKNVNSSREKHVKYMTPRSLKGVMNFTFHNETVKSLEKVLHRKKDEILLLPSKLAPRRSQPVLDWTEYPYIAAYIYERFQMHCDAAVISAHWLMASGSCLSRHSDDPGGEGRSAFITYCGGTWWNPERVNYVKYIVVHPMFHPKDRTRKYLYNIGLIQVVTSMATACPNWAPVILMSYRYSGNDGSVAVAAGWGLDRYGVKYGSSDLPRRPLSVYAGSVYSDSCPGNSGYQKAKDENDEGLKNVYCLALPNYSREDLDPLHGGLLIVGGKLIALYLQEERRIQGDQSAEYTGVWRLLPWVNEVAREPEETDFLLQ